MRRRTRFATIPAFPAPAHCRYNPNLISEAIPRRIG
jgi:hypothetical protein